MSKDVVPLARSFGSPNEAEVGGTGTIQGTSWREVYIELTLRTELSFFLTRSRAWRTVARNPNFSGNSYGLSQAHGSQTLRVDRSGYAASNGCNDHFRTGF